MDAYNDHLRCFKNDEKFMIKCGGSNGNCTYMYYSMICNFRELKYRCDQLEEIDLGIVPIIHMPTVEFDNLLKLIEYYTTGNRYIFNDNTNIEKINSLRDDSYSLGARDAYEHISLLILHKIPYEIKLNNKKRKQRDFISITSRCQITC